jgi:organic radical activating enzyme
MSDMIPPSKLLGVTLLHKCNFNCPHCGYLYTGDSDDHEVKPGYRLTWEQIRRLVADCKSIENERFGFVLNGGEPTLWEEGDRKFIDLLLTVAGDGIVPSFNTNGSFFEDFNMKLRVSRSVNFRCSL